MDPERKARRRALIEAGAMLCRSMRTPKLKDQLHTVETGAEPVSALAFHPYHQVGGWPARWLAGVAGHGAWFGA